MTAKQAVASLDTWTDTRLAQVAERVHPAYVALRWKWAAIPEPYPSIAQIAESLCRSRERFVRSLLCLKPSYVVDGWESGSGGFMWRMDVEVTCVRLYFELGFEAEPDEDI